MLYVQFMYSLCTVQCEFSEEVILAEKTPSEGNVPISASFSELTAKGRGPSSD